MNKWNKLNKNVILKKKSLKYRETPMAGIGHHASPCKEKDYMIFRAYEHVHC